MIEYVYRCDPNVLAPKSLPETAAQAIDLLQRRQEQVASALNAPADQKTRLTLPMYAEDLGTGEFAGKAPAQKSFASVLCCSDARVPPEFLFGQTVNDLFVVRVAGNVPSGDCVGSLDYAVATLNSMRLLAVLGHTRCGAVTATVDAYLHPSRYMAVAANLPLRVVVDSLMPEVHAAAFALDAAYGADVKAWPGYRSGLIELAVVLNAAISASVLRRTFSHSINERLDVAFGVYNLQNHVVGLPAATDTGDPWAPGLALPPADDAALQALGERMARTRFIQRLLKATA